MIDHTKINNTDRIDIGVEDIECMMETGRPTVTGITEPGLDTWFKYVQSTVIDDTEMALGQYLTKIDGEVLLNNKLNKDYGGLDILALYTSNLTLNAGDGYFEIPTSTEYEDESAKEKEVKRVIHILKDYADYSDIICFSFFLFLLL